MINLAILVIGIRKNRLTSSVLYTQTQFLFFFFFIKQINPVIEKSPKHDHSEMRANKCLIITFFFSNSFKYLRLPDSYQTSSTIMKDCQVQPLQRPLVTVWMPSLVTTHWRPGPASQTYNVPSLLNLPQTVLYRQ